MEMIDVPCFLFFRVDLYLLVSRELLGYTTSNNVTWGIPWGGFSTTFRKQKTSKTSDDLSEVKLMMMKLCFVLLTWKSGLEEMTCIWIYSVKLNSDIKIFIVFHILLVKYWIGATHIKSRRKLHWGTYIKSLSYIQCFFERDRFDFWDR